MSSGTCAGHFHSVLAFHMWADYPHAIASLWLSLVRAAAVTSCGAVVAIPERGETPGSQGTRSKAPRQEDLHGLDLGSKKGVGSSIEKLSAGVCSALWPDRGTKQRASFSKAKRTMLKLLTGFVVIAAASGGRAPDKGPPLPEGWCSEAMGTATRSTGECMCR